MEAYEKEEVLYKEVYSVIDRISMEYELTHAQIIGVLNIISSECTNNFFESNGVEDEDS